MSSLLQSDPLFCSQNCVLEKDASRRLVQSKFFLSGLGSMGVEIAKDLLCAGVSQITLQDHRIATYDDICGHFLLNEDDVNTQKNRAQISHAKLSALNPHANIHSITAPLTNCLDLLEEFDCVILTEVELQLQKQINNLCRNHDPPMKFLSADSYGPLASLFCDFGETFSVLEPDTEHAEELHVSHISKSNPGIVRCHDSCRLSNYETGDWVEISLVRGMSAVNDIPLQIEVLSLTTFSICDTSSLCYGDYVGGGIIRKLKKPVNIHYESLEKQMYEPKIQFSLQEENSQLAHLVWLALHSFVELHMRPPHPWNQEDAEELFQHAVQIQEQHYHFQVALDKKKIMLMALTCCGHLPPLTTVMGGICAQEAIKAVTGKFVPLQQWLHLDYSHLVATEMDEKMLVQKDRYVGNRICLGESMMNRLSSLKLFIVGCSVVSSEYLKNAALLGIGTHFGKITIADDAEMKKSNLGQHFLLSKTVGEQERHLKCTALVRAVKSINSAVHLEVILHKVCPDNASVFNEKFFTDKKIVMTALDTMEGRRYVDRLCVKHSLPLIDCGTTGTKGHVQVVIPHHSESFSCKFDPLEPEYPYCVLKSFPTKVEHAVQWARDKFENFFFVKPSVFNKFWAANDPKTVLQNLQDNIVHEHLPIVLKCLSRVPKDFCDCLKIARLQYEKYFVNKAKQLLQNFPPDLTVADGSLFWQFPKMLPVPLLFDVENETHMKFVVATAYLLAYCSRITPSEQEKSSTFIAKAVSTTEVPEFVPRNKHIITDESITKPETNNSVDEFNSDSMSNQLARFLSKNLNAGKREINALNFETNGQQAAVHEFIIAAATLRAQMYGIKVSSPEKLEMIARRLTPFLPTSTAVAGGFAMLELLEMVRGLPCTNHRNYFFNLAIPEVVTSSPSPAKVTSLSNGVCFTLWDRWSVYGTRAFTLKELLEELKHKAGSEVTLVADGTKMVYMPLFPTHKKRLNQTMTSLIQNNSADSYVELSVSYEGLAADDDLMGPPIRYHFGNEL